MLQLCRWNYRTEQCIGCKMGKSSQSRFFVFYCMQCCVTSTINRYRYIISSSAKAWYCSTTLLCCKMVDSNGEGHFLEHFYTALCFTAWHTQSLSRMNHTISSLKNTRSLSKSTQNIPEIHSVGRTRPRSEIPVRHNFFNATRWNCRIGQVTWMMH